ncbi:hypothetical protein ETAA8_17050 [Anatilimnocola aggregata]|uniref:Uncharacterized protein n=1 Tax=Anatilimnocola aggregata TaxID=2528021 RepID=A0A517Y8T5_9BACT|nr:hypothetical protein ETAA8_17050 [Anatilimnocola aggregata]
MDGAVNLPCCADQIPETVIITTLRASCGGHHSIMTNPTGRATRLMEIAASIRLKWRELAQKTPEGRDTQHGNARRSLVTERRFHLIHQNLVEIAVVDLSSNFLSSCGQRPFFVPATNRLAANSMLHHDHFIVGEFLGTAGVNDTLGSRPAIFDCPERMNTRTFLSTASAEERPRSYTKPRKRGNVGCRRCITGELPAGTRRTVFDIMRSNADQCNQSRSWV